MAFGAALSLLKDVKDGILDMLNTDAAQEERGAKR